LAVPVLAGSASYAIAETLGWKSGLYLKLKDAHGFYGIITIATLIGLLINFTPIQPFQMLYYSAAFNGILAPPLVIIIVLLASDKSYMGRYRNRFISTVMGWIIAGIMGVCGVGLVAQWIF
jgi:Mn2+/Fe2+ NRAMP family transporter